MTCSRRTPWYVLANAGPHGCVADGRVVRPRTRVDTRRERIDVTAGRIRGARPRPACGPAAGGGHDGDLNGDGFITASELAAYTGPIVSSLSRQTPAFGSLAGSEGGEFVFQLAHETEALSDVSAQLDEEAIQLNRELERLRKSIADKRSRNERLRSEVERARAEIEGAAPPRNASADANDRGMTLYREKRYPEAAAAFEEAVRLSPRNALAANNAGFTYFKMKRYSEAVQWFERTLELDPNRAIAHANLGDAWLALGRVEDARRAFEKYLELQPNGQAAAMVRSRLKDMSAR